MTAIEQAIAEASGQLHFEIKAILAFARITTGDIFEVYIKHGHQRWKSRAKIQSDKSQRWEQKSVVLDLDPREPISIKVSEVRFLKLEKLNQRMFDPTKFMADQSQLVTMNLNSIGSIKLQLISTWMPLGVSKQEINLLNDGPKASVHTRAKSYDDVADKKQIAYCTKTNDDINPSPLASEDITNLANGKDPDSHMDTPPKICLREKKRQREQIQQQRQSLFSDKASWRTSSTSILDDLYKDIARSIPTIDDLSALNISKNPALPPYHRSTFSESDNRVSKYGGSSSSSSILFAPNHEKIQRRKMSPKRIFSFIRSGCRSQYANYDSSPELDKKDWRKSASLSHISISKDEQFMSANEHCVIKPNVSDNKESESSPRKSRLSSLKKSRVQQQQQLLPSMTSENNVREIKHTPTSPVHLMNTTVTSSNSSIQSYQQCQNVKISPTPPSPLKNKTAIYNDKILPTNCDSESLSKINTLLIQIDALRTLISQIRSENYSELDRFEAAMLKWEAHLKLSRSCILESNKSSVKRSNSYIQRVYGKRCSMSSNASDETEHSQIVLGQSYPTADQASENDSGIDSLRQYVSPYNLRETTSAQFVEHRHIINHKDRRKSIDSILNPNIDPVENQKKAALSNKNERDEYGQTYAPCQICPLLPSATGSVEVDKCLEHHLQRTLKSLKIVSTTKCTPLRYNFDRILSIIDREDTIALETLLKLQDQLPRVPNIKNLTHQLGADRTIQEIWCSICSSLNIFVLSPTEFVRHQIHLHILPIVQERYPNLIEKVLNTVMNMLNEASEEGYIVDQNSSRFTSLFQITGLFHRKRFAPFIENLSHEAWIITKLSSERPNTIREVMERLSNVPIVPPLESLRHMGLVLANENQNLVPFVERYLQKAHGQLTLDLADSFVCLLEYKDDKSRLGACRAIGFLKADLASGYIKHLAQNDPSKEVRVEAEKALNTIECHKKEYHETTKI